MSVNGDVNKFLNLMEVLLVKGNSIPLTPMVLVNQEKLLNLLDKIRATLPSEIQEAAAVLAEKDQILEQAKQQAESLVRDAGEHAKKLIDEHEVMKAVKQEAEKVKNEVVIECKNAREQAQRDTTKLRAKVVDEVIAIREGAERYAESIFNRLDADISELSQVVEAGQKQLSRLKTETMTKINQYKAFSATGQPLDSAEAEQQN